MTGTDGIRWLRRYHPAPVGAPRLVCLPFAGGSASYFHPLSAALPAVEVLAAQYPGRQDRFTEPLLRDLHAMADAVVAELPDDGVRTVLFGHSMGALVGYEVARRLEGRGAGPSHLFVSGRPAPGRPRPGGPLHTLDDDRLLAQVRTLGGPGVEMLDDPQLVEVALPAIRADYAALELHEHRPGAPLHCAITALTGDADPVVTPGEMREWADHTSGPFDLRVYPGGHFYLTEHADAVRAVLVEAL
jgi:pyochelin biosynthesis protein PchC